MSCGQPPRVSNSAIAGTAWTYPNQVQYSCTTGYNLIGAVALQCASSGNWSGQVPACVVRQCPRLNFTANLIIGGNQTATQYNTLLTFSCETGYNMNGSTSTRCLADQSWSNDVPTCNIARCPSIAQPPDGQAVFSSLTYSSTVNYSCDPGFESNLNVSVSRCQANGEWSVQNFTCCGECCMLYTHAAFPR